MIWWLLGIGIVVVTVLGVLLSRRGATADRIGQTTSGSEAQAFRQSGNQGGIGGP